MDENSITYVKTCARCNTSKGLTEFKIRNGKPHCWCISCTREYIRNKMREYRQNPGVARPRSHEYLSLPPPTDILALVIAIGVYRAAKQLNCHYLTVISRLKKAGLYTGFARKTRVTVKSSTLYDLYFNQSKSFDEIRKECGCTMWHLSSTFKKEGWISRPSRRRTKIEKEAIKEKAKDLFGWER